ncbi:MAG: hypothetical protein ACOCXQ_03150 [Patescibacteria group bacterium]
MATLKYAVAVLVVMMLLYIYFVVPVQEYVDIHHNYPIATYETLFVSKKRGTTLDVERAYRLKLTKEAVEVDPQCRLSQIASNQVQNAAPIISYELICVQPEGGDAKIAEVLTQQVRIDGQVYLAAEIYDRPGGFTREVLSSRDRLFIWFPRGTRGIPSSP